MMFAINFVALLVVAVVGALISPDPRLTFASIVLGGFGHLILVALVLRFAFGYRVFRFWKQ